MITKTGTVDHQLTSFIETYTMILNEEKPQMQENKDHQTTLENIFHAKQTYLWWLPPKDPMITKHSSNDHQNIYN